jgi:SAM-dependent methyltransferase
VGRQVLAAEPLSGKRLIRRPPDSPWRPVRLTAGLRRAYPESRANDFDSSLGKPTLPTSEIIDSREIPVQGIEAMEGWTPLNLQTAERHLSEIRRNCGVWERKPLLQAIYGHFYELIRQNITPVPGTTVELGSGIGSIKDLIPDCITTDLFPNPRIDRRENAYALSFPDASISNLILLDVFHHLQFPGTALREFERVVAPRGRVILFEPGLGILGRLVYGLFHREPLALRRSITWLAPSGFHPECAPYYAAQGNAWRIFVRNEFPGRLEPWKVRRLQQLPEMAYIASGGFTKLQLYPGQMLSLIRRIEKLAARWPAIFATRLLVVLEKG